MTSIKSLFQKTLLAVVFGLFFCAPAVADCPQTPVPMPTPMRAPTSSGCSKGGLHYAIYGKTGVPLLAIHGLGASMYSWRHFVAHDGTFPGYQIILIDLKGAGTSVRPHDNNYSILTQRDLVLQLIDELKLKNLTLVGNSYGGAVSLLVAIELCKPQRAGILSKLILIDSGGYDLLLPWYLKLLRTPIIGWLVLHLMSARFAADTVLKDAYYNDALITEPQIAAYAAPIGARGGRYALLQIAKGVIPPDIGKITSEYRTINVPTHILWGLNDEVIPLQIGEMLHAAIAGSRLELINDCGHVPQEEKPAETICWMKNFLGLPPGSCPK
jgi:pimeloyl-ACP methyl ester carboxylesterase